MSTSCPPSLDRRLTTPEVEAARKAFARAIAERLAASHFSRNTAEAKLSRLLAEIWDELAPAIRRLPKTSS